jgi:hypothetical protein
MTMRESRRDFTRAAEAAGGGVMRVTIQSRRRRIVRVCGLVLALLIQRVDGAAAEFKPLEEAKEIIDGGTILTHPELPLATYKSSEDPGNPGHEISDDAWADYTPPSPYVKNTTRNLQFNESEFLGSPGEPPGVFAYIQTSDGYTWGAMSTAISAMWPYDRADYSGLAAVNAYYAGNLVTTPGEGIVKITANFKAQNMKFYANEGGVSSDTPGAVKLDRYLVRDAWDNVYIMHASGQTDQSQVAAAFAASVLPAGWSKQTIQLDDDLILHPAEGSDGSYHYLVFRDSADNTYHQIAWGGQGISLAAHVAGLPIWGGQTSDALRGDVGAVRDDLIHAAGGDDLLRPGRGNDIVWGDAGTDTVVLEGHAGDYTLVDHSDDLTTLVLSGRGDTKELHDVELLTFDDGTVSVASLVTPPSICTGWRGRPAPPARQRTALARSGGDVHASDDPAGGECVKTR